MITILKVVFKFWIALKIHFNQIFMKIVYYGLSLNLLYMHSQKKSKYRYPELSKNLSLCLFNQTCLFLSKHPPF